MKYLIDTNTCIYIMNKRPADVIRKFKQFDPGEISISSITVSELQCGVEKSAHPKKNRLRLEQFMAPFKILPYDEFAAKTYGNIRFQLEKQGHTIGPLDLFIAAHALSQELILVTNNDKEFKRIKNLKVENWA